MRICRWTSIDVFPASEVLRPSNNNPRRHKGGGGVNLTPPPPSIFLALIFFSLTDHQKLWYNGSLFVKRSFEPNYVTSS